MTCIEFELQVSSRFLLIRRWWEQMSSEKNSALGCLGYIWRIIPVGKWLGSPPSISRHLGHLDGEEPYLGDLR